MKPTLLFLCAILAACASKSDKIPVHLANAGPGLQPYSLPITLAKSLGYFSEEGLDVTVETLPSIGKALQALVGGSVDAAAVSFAQVLQVAAEGQHLRSFFTMNRRGSNTLLIAPSATDRIRRPEDLKGALIGVSSPGSSTHIFANHYLAAHGVQPSEFRTIGIGAGAPAIAAIESGRIDAAAVGGGDHLILSRRFPNLRILIDSSTAEGLREIYGGDVYASGVLSARPEWLASNPDTARRLARALRRTHQWIAAHPPEDLLDKLPTELRSADRSMDIEILRWGMESYTADGQMPPGAPEVMLRYVQATIPAVRDAKIDLAASWTNQFLNNAN